MAVGSTIPNEVAGGGKNGQRPPVSLIIGVHMGSLPDLLEVTEAGSPAAFLASRTQRRHEQRCKNPDDGNDNQQLNERKRIYGRTGSTLHDVFARAIRLRRQEYAKRRIRECCTHGIESQLAKPVETGIDWLVSATIDKVQIPLLVLESVETLDELEDWLMSHNPAVMAELSKARQDDQAGKFRPWKPRFAAWPTKSK